jgi:hypothetical protein
MHGVQSTGRLPDSNGLGANHQAEHRIQRSDDLGVLHTHVAFGPGFCNARDLRCPNRLAVGVIVSTSTHIGELSAR